MSWFVLLLLYGVSFSLHFISYGCEGKIISPPDGTEFTFLPGSNRSITWIFDDDISQVVLRTWSFASSVGSLTRVLAILTFDTQPIKRDGILPAFDIKKPATLILNNVNQSYNGTYRLGLNIDGVDDDFISDVTVFIAKTSVITVNCSSHTTLNKKGYFACVCKGQGGNPPADVTWYKGSLPIVSGKEEAILRLPNVDKNDSGTYRCEAKSHEEAKNETTIELIVNYPPEEPYSKEKTVVGKTFAITCESDGHPSPRYTITHNDTKVVSNDKTYTIDVVQYSDAGFYKCIAENKLGNSSTIYYLSILDQLIKPTTDISTQRFSTRSAANKEDDGATVEVWHVVVSLVSGIIIGILLSHIVSCFRRKFRSRKPQSNPESKTTEVNITYQELDLSKMNTEDNYQSLRLNVASNDDGNRAGNDDDSTYTELNKTRDVENNYQSLT